MNKVNTDNRNVDSMSSKYKTLNGQLGPFRPSDDRIEYFFPDLKLATDLIVGETVCSANLEEICMEEIREKIKRKKSEQDT